MTFDEEMAGVAEELLTEFGAPLKVTRPDGASVGSGFGVFVTLEGSLDPSQAMQTALTSRTLLVSALKQEVQVGDLITIGKELYSVRAVSVTRPTNRTIMSRCEVVYG